jgi:eukaryotic-like serine/threonine-protein kinase
MDDPPKTIGRFEILRELGRGMMGVVYEAHDPVLTRTVALKTIKPAYARATGEGDAFERRFESEARIAGRLSHPNIVVVHDVGRDPATGILYIALERLRGETLAVRVERGERFPWREALEIARQVAEALEHAHSEGVVHRDIKPANVMLLPSGQVKLMDFGIAKLEASRMTAAGQFFGTPLYMSPEQARSMEVDARADLFSLGSVLYTLLTGRHAFAGTSVIQIVQHVAMQDPPPPSRLTRGLPKDVDYVVARCLAKAPADRYPDARSLAEDLSDVIEGLPPRHRANWSAPQTVTAELPALPAGLGSGGFAPTLTADPGLEPLTEGPPTSRFPDKPRPAQRRGRRLLMWLGAVWVLALVVGLLLRPGALAPAGPASPAPAAGQPSPSPAPSPAGTAAGGTSAVPVPGKALRATPRPKPTPVPAQVVVDFRHALESGTLRVWVDDERVVGQPVRGAVSKDLLVVKLREGVFTDVFAVDPGTHRIRVEVRWDDEMRGDVIPGRFLPGETYRLEIRMGRLSKDLSLRWTR